MGLFGFMDMADNYEDRVVDRFEKRGKLIIDTCEVTDSDKDYETAVSCFKYNKGKWVIVELYDTKTEAQKGHNKWVKKMTAKSLPKALKDISTSETAEMCDVFAGKEDWRTKKA